VDAAERLDEPVGLVQRLRARVVATEVLRRRSLDVRRQLPGGLAAVVLPQLRVQTLCRPADGLVHAAVVFLALLTPARRVVILVGHRAVMAAVRLDAVDLERR